MRTLQEKYNAIQEGAFSKDQFLRDARLQLPNLITQYNGYDDAVKILKNKGMIQEGINPQKYLPKIREVIKNPEYEIGPDDSHMSEAEQVWHYLAQDFKELDNVSEAEWDRVNNLIKAELKNRGTLSESTYAEAEEQLTSAPIGAKATGGGYGPFEKIKSNTWQNTKANSLQHSQALARHIGGFEDFKIQESIKENNINEDLSDYSNDALTDMIINLSRYEGNEDIIARVKAELERRKKDLKEARLTKNSLTDYRYKPTNDMDKYPYEQILRGLRVELEVMQVYGTPTADEYKKALAKVLKNLEKDEIFYTNQLAGHNKKVDLHDKFVDATAKNTVDTFNGMKKIKDLKENTSPLNNLPDGKYFAIDGDWDEEYKGHNGLFFTLKGPNLTGSDGQNFQTSPEEFLSQFTPDEIIRVEESGIKEDHSKNPDDKYVVKPCKDKKEPWAVWEGEKRVKGFGTKEQAKEYADKQNKKQGLSEIGMFNDPIGYKKSEPTPQAYTKKFVKATDKRGVYVYDIFKNGKLVKTIEGGEGDANAWINNAQRRDNSQELTEKVLKEGIKNLIKKALMEEEDLERAERGVGNPYGTEEEYDFYRDFEQEPQEDEIYEMQGPKSDQEYKSELADYLEDNQIYGYTDMIFDIMTGPDEQENSEALEDFLDDHQIYGYNRGIERIFADYPYHEHWMNQPDDEETFEDLFEEVGAGKRVTFTNKNDGEKYTGTVVRDLGNGRFTFRADQDGKVYSNDGMGSNWKIEFEADREEMFESVSLKDLLD